MSTQVQFRRGTTTQNNAFTGAQGELSVDTDLKTIRLHDGTTAGGGSTMLNNVSAQTALNKTFSTGSVWQGSAVGLGYGGTGSALTAAAGAVPYSTSSGLALNTPGTSGQILASGGTGAPTWVAASSITAGAATLATTATNIAGGSAGQLIIQSDTSLSTFITAGASGTFLRSEGAGYAPSWATADVTIGTTVIALGSSSTSLAGLNILTATGTSNWKIPVGTTDQRPGTPATGMIRYNSTISSFEGYGSSAWASLGGVKSVDALTYIQAETSAGASNGDLDFYAEDSAGTAATQIGQWNRTNLKDYTGTLVGTQTTQAVFNTTATTVNAFGAATTLAIGNATSATLTLRPGTVVGSNTTQNLYNTVATTGNLFGAATTVSIGAATGTASINNATITLGNATTLNVNGASPTIASTSTGTLTLFNANLTTVNAFGASTATTLGATTGTHTINNPTVVGTQTTVNLWNTTSTTVNAFGAATALNLGAATGTLTVANTTLAAKAITASTTLAVIGATTLTGALSANGGITVDSTAFVVADTTGNVSTTGTLTVTGATVLNGGLTMDTNKFTVADTTGNTSIGGTLGVAGVVSFTDTTDTSALGTSAVVMSGGLSVAKKLHVGTNAEIDGNLVIDGNFTVNGTTTTISATNLAIEDNLIYLNEGSTITNPDLGWSGNYNDGTYRHAGMFRDASDGGKFKIFRNYTPEPASAIDTTHATYDHADLQIGGLTVDDTATIGSTLSVTGETTLLSTLHLGHATDTTLARSAAGVVTIEGVEIVTLSRSQTLTNKTLTSPVISTIVNSGTLTLPTATDTLVGKATTDTLTNKTIAAGSNTISGLTNSNLSGSAGITNANLANSTISGVSLGSNLNSINAGTGLSGTAYNGSAAQTWTLAASGVTAASYGSASAVPVIAIDTYGRITSASTATITKNLTVGTRSTPVTIAVSSGSLTVAGRSGNTSVTLTL